MNQAKYIRHRKESISDRQIDELVGIAKGMLADDRLVDEEILFLHEWMVDSQYLVELPLIRNLYDRISDALQDGLIDEDERRDLRETLEQFTGKKEEFGELPRATTLPVDRPAPPLVFTGKRFCMTGTFNYGTRKECESIVEELGGRCGGMPTMKTDYVVIGTYVTDSWKHSNHGHKIKKACEIRDKKGAPLTIVTEEHWASFLPET